MKVMKFVLLSAGISANPEDIVCTEDNSSHTTFSPAAMTCSELVQTLFLSRRQVVVETRRMAAELNRADVPVAEAQQAVSRAHALLLSQLHMASALFQAKGATEGAGCLTEQLKFIFVAGIRKAQTAEEERWKFLFNGEVSEAQVFVTRVAELFEIETKALAVFLRSEVPEVSEQHYTHENDGRLTTLEALRRTTFEEEAVDEEFLRNFQKLTWSQGWTQDLKVADFGAGTGRYSEILRDTGNFGLVDAFDGTDDVDIVTRDKVRHANLLTPGIFVGNLYHWTLAIRVLDQLEDQTNFLKALDRHSLFGTIVTWSSPSNAASFALSPKTPEEVVSIFENNTNFRFNQELTDDLRRGTALRDELFLFTKN